MPSHACLWAVLTSHCPPPFLHLRNSQLKTGKTSKKVLHCLLPFYIGGNWAIKKPAWLASISQMFFIFFFFFGVDVDACVSPRGTKKILAPRRKKKKRTKKWRFWRLLRFVCGNKKIVYKQASSGIKKSFLWQRFGRKKTKKPTYPRSFPTSLHVIFPQKFQIYVPGEFSWETDFDFNLHSVIMHFGFFLLLFGGEICQTIPLPSCGRLLISQSRKFRNKREKTAHFRTQKRRVARRPHPFFLSLNPHPQGE